jgi:hypothetical protein
MAPHSIGWSAASSSPVTSGKAALASMPDAGTFVLAVLQP